MQGGRARALAGAVALAVIAAASMAIGTGAGASPASLPAVPTGLHAVGVSLTQIDLTWNRALGATGYTVQRATRSAGPYTSIGVSSATSFIDMGLTGATTYYYTVESTNTSGTSAPCAPVAGATWPVPPLGVVAKGVSVSEIDLSWKPARTATSYRVLHGVASSGPFTIVGSSTTVSFADTGLAEGTKYYYEVEALNSGGTSVPSRLAAALTFPGAPAGVRAKAVSATQISLNWTAVTGAASYVVSRSTTTGGPYTAVGSTHASTFTSSGLNAATTYYFVVQGQNGSGLSPDSLEVSALTTPAAPGGVSATPMSSSQINLEWSPVSGATSYRVLQSATSGGPYQNVGSPTTTGLVDIGLVAATTYYFVVQATDASGPSARSAEISGLTDPAAPTGVTATAVAASEIDLSWSAVTGATGYVIERAANSGGPYTAVGSSTTASFADTGLNATTPYYYVVQATDASGPSVNSAEASATTLVETPTGVVATAVSPSEIDLSWNVVTGATGYVVRRATTIGGPYSIVGTPTSASFNDSGLAPATPYYYTLTASIGAETSAPSAPVSATTLLSTPTGLIATGVSFSQIALSWNAVGGATGYVVQRATTSGGPYTTVGQSASASFDSGGLASATTYYYVVEATAGAVTSPASAEVSAMTLPAAPVGVTANAVSRSQITIMWQPVSGASGYTILRSTTSGGPYTSIGSTTSTSFADLTVNEKTTYYYVVEATDAAGNSLPSAQVSATTPD
jgi:fibronectin type 3 domain-containing protein